MATTIKAAKGNNPVKESKKLIDVYFDQYAANHQNHANEVVHWICIPLIVFSLLGLVWAIPFPHLNFLGQYNGFFNWASFVIAFAIFYYYRLSPILSYFMLVLLFAFSFGIIQLEAWGKAGGPALWQSCLVVFILSWIGQFMGHKIEGRRPAFLQDVKFLLIGPAWLLHFILLRWKVKY